MNPDDYDWVILVGSDAMKYFTKQSSVTEFSGKKVDDKFLPVINPAMLAFKPEAKKTWERSVESIHDYIAGNIEDVVIDDSIAFGIQDTEKANEFIQAAIEQTVDMLRSIPRQLAYTLVMGICWVLVFPTMVSVALTLTLIALMMKLNDFCRNYLTKRL